MCSLPEGGELCGGAVLLRLPANASSGAIQKAICLVLPVSCKGS